MSKKSARDREKAASAPKSNTPRGVGGRSRAAALGAFLRAKIYGVAAAGLGLVLVLAVLVVWRPWPFAQEQAKKEDDSAPPKLNPFHPPGQAPPGMVWIPGGEFWMGFAYDDDERFSEIPGFFERFADCMPAHKVYVDGFWMDKTEVTNEQFAAFVKATGYVTNAEKPADPTEYAEILPEFRGQVFSFVFQQLPPGMPIFNASGEHYKWFRPTRGACWKHPEGPGSTIKGRAKHPVVHISWNDAVAYCKWANKRLPTEAEWEFAARGGLDRNKYGWGDEFLPNDKWQLNIWQGKFPVKDEGLDGYKGTAPVGSFPPNGYGLHDMAGNVWEWCADYYQPKYYEESPQRNPQGPFSGYDPQEPGISKRVQRGGSFLCADSYCNRYLPAARGRCEPVSSGNHTGFRCVRSP